MPVTMKAGDARKCLEKSVMAEGLRDEDDVSINPEQVALSQAASLKRIADVLEDSLIHLSPEGAVKGLADLVADTEGFSGQG